MSLVVADEATTATILELTERLRRATIERRAGTLLARLKTPLGDLLETFIATNDFGQLAAVAYLAGEPGAPSIDALGIETERKTNGADVFAQFVWGPAVTAMVRKVLEKDGVACLPDLLSGLSALADCTAGFTSDMTLIDVPQEKMLPHLVDRIATAYVAGAALAWRGRTATAPKHIQLVRAALPALKPDERRLLVDRYEKQFTNHEMERAHDLGLQDLVAAIGTAMRSLQASLDAAASVS